MSTPMIRFIRTTHHHGRPRSFPVEARQFWQEHGAIVGEVLRPETPLTFAEVVTATREYALETPENGLYWTLTEEQIAWCLLKLLEHGLAAVHPPSSPTRSI